MHRLSILCLLLACWLSSALAPPALAQQQDPEMRQADTGARLDVIRGLIDSKVMARDRLRQAIKQADPQSQPEMQKELDALNDELKRLRGNFEQVAIGSIDMDVFGDKPTTFDWREEVTQILQPLVENLKSLTEKPRKVEMLRATIERKREQLEAVDRALESIEQQIIAKTGGATGAALIDLRANWQQRRADTSGALEIATFQLQELLNDNGSWWGTTKEALLEFLRGRGLTLVIAIGAALVFWYLMRWIAWFFQKQPLGTGQHELKTRRRLIQYGFRALTMVVILIVVVSVFYVRGDMLLMGLAILAIAAFGIGLRHTVPRFVAESRLLLNVGAIRENERVIYNGLPWQVVSLNLYSVLRNPELTGVLRLPLSQLAELVSRPAGKEPWFPASRGDFIMLEDGRLFEVNRQTPETVELRNLAGVMLSVRSTDFLGWSFSNLSRGGTFAVAGAFGLSYRHQAIGNDEVPKRLAQALRRALSETNLAEHVKDVTVELKAAGASSLDYGLYVTMDSAAARFYFRIERIIQQTCVTVCSEERWEIPYPHLTIVRAEA